MRTELWTTGIRGSGRERVRPAGSFDRLLVYWAMCLFAIMLAACESPQVSAVGPTPIPTLIPATMVPSIIEVSEPPPAVVESFPAGIPSASAGQALYAEHCAECHGEDGKGQVPFARDFSDVDFIRGETPAAFYIAITEGVTSAEVTEDPMPAFGEQLSSDERWDLVYYIWRFSTTEERLRAGNEIYSSFCVECHGPDGRSMILDAADLSDQRFIATLSPSELYLATTQGRGSMPAWQARLSQNERWAVIDYLRTFSYDPELPDETPTVVEEPPAEEEGPPPCDPAYLALTNPFGWDNAQAIASGEPIYDRECTECHGEDGTGEIPQAPDLTNPAVRGSLIDDAGEAFCRVSEGLNRMPAFKDALSEEEIWQALTYSASFGN